MIDLVVTTFNSVLRKEKEMYLTIYKPVKRDFFTHEEWQSRKYTKVIPTLDDYNPNEEIATAIANANNNPDVYWALGLDYLSILKNKAAHYRSFQIPKRDGSMRDIKTPTGNLKVIQKNICYLMKSELKILPHDCCHGFVKHRKCLSAMQRHQENGSMWFLKLDIKNFFPSISSGLIYETFKTLPQTASLTPNVRRLLVDLLTDETGHLTQGCISSPYIANLVLMEFDYKFSTWCAENNLTYTRYADDMCISSRVKFKVGPVVNEVKSLLPPGLHINKEKTKLTSFNQENVFLGLHYNQNKDITVGYKTKHLMKVIDHKASLGQIPFEERSLWKGRLAYYSSIEPDYFVGRFDNIRNL